MAAHSGPTAQLVPIQIQLQWLQSDQGWSLVGLASPDLFRLFQYWYDRDYPKPWVKLIDPERVNPDRRSVDLEPRLAQYAPVVPPMWGPHCTIIYPGSVVPRHPEVKCRVRVGIDYRPLHLNHLHFWYPVVWPQLQQYRDQYGLGPPRAPFHLTVARLRET